MNRLFFPLSCLLLVYCFSFDNACAGENDDTSNSVSQDPKFSVISIFNPNESGWVSQIRRVRNVAGEIVYSFAIPSSKPNPNTIVLGANSYSIELACISPSLGLNIVNKELDLEHGDHYLVFCAGADDSPYLVSQKQ